MEKKRNYERLNGIRAGAAWKAIKPFVSVGLYRDRESQIDGAVDLVTDIMHWCRATPGIDWEMVLRRAEMHFKAETPKEVEP
jgi:hypothetical protein